VRELVNFVLDGEHTLLVSGVVCCTVGRDCGDRLRRLRPDHVSLDPTLCLLSCVLSTERLRSTGCGLWGVQLAAELSSMVAGSGIVIRERTQLVLLSVRRISVCV
jgi:hypothetical protein